VGASNGPLNKISKEETMAYATTLETVKKELAEGNAE